MANRLAHFLRATYDIRPDDLVGLMTDALRVDDRRYAGHSQGEVAHMFQVDPHYPAERVQYMLQDAGVKAVIPIWKNGYAFGLPQFSNKVCLQRQCGNRSAPFLCK